MKNCLVNQLKNMIEGLRFYCSAAEHFYALSCEPPRICVDNISMASDYLIEQALTALGTSEHIAIVLNKATR